MSGLLALVVGNLAVACVIALVALASQRWLKRPALSHGLWLLFFVKLLTPPLFPLPVAWLASERMPEARASDMIELAALETSRSNPDEEWPNTGATQEPVAWDIAEELPAPQVFEENDALLPIAASPAAPDWNARFLEHWPWIVGGIWLAGSLWWLGLAGLRLLRFQRLLRFAQTAPNHWQEESDNIAQALGIRGPRLSLVPGQISPMLWVLGRTPRLLVPVGLLERLDTAQRQSLFAHELAHWRRRDHWVRWLELAVLGLYWWCPLVWWARARLQQAEEECCDAWVVWMMPGAARGYALALVETVDFLSGARAALPPVASGIGHVQLLQRRLTMILRGRTPRALTAGGTLALVALGALLLPFAPVWGQVPPTPGGGEVNVSGVAQAAPGQDPKELRQRREELERARQEIARAQEDSERLRAELERKTRQLSEAMDQLRRAEEQARGGKDVPGKGRTDPGKKERTYGFDKKEWSKEMKRAPLDAKPMGGGGFGGGGFGMMGGGLNPNVERRLDELERKMDRLLKAFEQMQSQPRPGAQPKGRPPGAGPGGFAPGGLPGGPPVPGAEGGFPGGGFAPPGVPGGPGGGSPGFLPPGNPPVAPGGVPGGGFLPPGAAPGAAPVPVPPGAPADPNQRRKTPAPGGGEPPVAP
ncbi:MAG: M48 family metalloprotease [Gemmataceae bacterium]|nr:M48 family metalloprotease [Gemmataceae bacterium]